MPAPSGVIAITLRQLAADRAPAPPEIAAAAEPPAPEEASSAPPPPASPAPPPRPRTAEARLAPHAAGKRPRPPDAKPEPPPAPPGPSAMVYAVYDVVVGAGGVVESVVLAQSSGTPRYDETGASMIRSTMTFEPPSEKQPTVTSVIVRFYPEER